MPARRRDRRRCRRERTMERLMADSSGAGRMTRGNGHSGLWQRLRGLLKARQDEAQLRETLEEIIDEIKEVEREEISGVPISGDERVMLVSEEQTSEFQALMRIT